MSGPIWEFPGMNMGLNSEALTIKGEAEEVILLWFYLVQNVSLIFVLPKPHQACDTGPSLLTQHIQI